MPAGYVAFQLGGVPWCEWWYSVILQVVEGESYFSRNQGQIAGQGSNKVVCGLYWSISLCG
jgi:hypothetical protein